MSAAGASPILWYEDEGATDVALVGGKFRGLAALAAAGAPVPPAFAVTTHGYREALGAAAAAPEVAQALAGVDPRAPESAEPAAAAIAAHTAAEPLPAALADEVRAAYARLCALAGTDDAPVAVRSSATAEDLADASFAGQQDTFLNVVGADAVLDAVRACWTSLYSARAILYRAAHPQTADGLAMAVVVQVLVPARVAGVMFTVDPQSGDPDHVVIEAAWGLGESVVAGMVTPDRYVVDKGTGRTTSSRVAMKTVQVVRCEGGTAAEPVAPAYQTLPCLTAGDRTQLAALGQRVEEHFGACQDIEWAIDDAGGRFLLQARPVTTLKG